MGISFIFEIPIIFPGNPKKLQKIVSWSYPENFIINFLHIHTNVDGKDARHYATGGISGKRYFFNEITRSI